MADSLSEFDLIDKIRERFRAPEGIFGIGDDCAVIPQKEGVETLVSTDMLIEGVHFISDDISPSQLGWKSLAVNLSDIAAMGGRPVGSFLSLALPRGLDESWRESFFEGYRQISEKFSCPLLGGDTNSSPDRICINVAILGHVDKGRAKMRGGAREGDLVCVTGVLGDSAAGFRIIREGVKRDSEAEGQLVERHYLPVPRLEAGRALAGMEGVHSMMDISDGVASDLGHILRASGVGAVVDTSLVPQSAELLEVSARYGWDALSLSLEGGEDYELLFTADPSTDLSAVPHYVIGEITKEKALVWKGSDKDFKGFRHF